MKLYIARHGHTYWNEEKRIQGSSDTDLSPKGILQAHALADQLNQMHVAFSYIYTSPQKRAKDTATIVSQVCGIGMVEMPNLQEIALGTWEGKTWIQVENDDPDSFRTWSHNRRYSNIHQGESYQQVLQRVLSGLRQIISNHQDDVLIVTHSGVVMALLSLLNKTPFEMMVQYHLNNAAFITLADQDVHQMEILL
ncbi:hypothetical protein AOC36_05145 [Erysipelothrix larvae]|uniref:Phosphoglycerate mutase n=1 Tax=Erysipelothrix larvae TaxID=1514105 RepID=A0A0X8GZM7_9FIRM|nr:histidine phosphatase family protein [Erysipelothrix larvae]AMC93384.1 hypothetical protein AOC36_05145 [Erysipelothrix larvae]